MKKRYRQSLPLRHTCLGGRWHTKCDGRRMRYKGFQTSELVKETKNASLIQICSTAFSPSHFVTAPLRQVCLGGSHWFGLSVHTPDTSTNPNPHFERIKRSAAAVFFNFLLQSVGINRIIGYILFTRRDFI